ncbi:hypothetical protein LCGC14_1330820 [marine sediment metagenome]|uniref:Uncharacterized protein n=1 Tax=marine sediment metagenome TaxID=412755 RepID=A0A0F9MXH2_9ZZZZ
MSENDITQFLLIGLLIITLLIHWVQGHPHQR